MAGFLAGAAVPLLKALGATATAGGAAMGVNWALGLPKELEKGVYTQGPNPDGNYSSSNPLVQIFTDEQDTEKMDALYREHLQRNDPLVRQRIQQLGGDTSAWVEGTTGSAFLADTAKTAKEKQALDEATKGYRSTLNAVPGRTFSTAEEALSATSQLNEENRRSTPEYQEAREGTKLQRLLLEQAQNDRIRDREHKREMDKRNWEERREERLRLAEKDKRSARTQLLQLEQMKTRDQYDMDKYMHELQYRKQSNRENRTSAIVQALAGLGAAFAI